MTHAQETIDALDEAGRLLAPILQAETGDDVLRWSPSVQIVRDGKFMVSGGNTATHATGKGETLSAAFFDFLAKRSDKLTEVEAEERQRAEFEAWKAQREGVAA